MQPGRGSEIDGGTELGVTEFCGTCVWHENFNGTTDWICSNEDSDSYGAVTSYDDYCIDYEQKQ